MTPALYFMICVSNMLRLAKTLSSSDILDNQAGQLKPVPVRVLNYRSNGIEVNENGGKSDLIDDVFTRRFFVYDTLSGVQQGRLGIIRIATSIELDITVQDDNPHRIYPPVLNIRYSEISIGTQSVGVTFRVQYLQNLSKFWNTSMIVLIVAMALTLVIWLFRVFLWMRRNLNPDLNCALFTRAIILLLDTAADILFWLLFAICCYMFLFFKGKDTVTILVPSLANAKPFIPVLAIVFVGKFIGVADLVWRQTHADVFFIDWEKPRGRLVTRGGEKPVNAPVSVWRVLMCANEWNEVQVGIIS